MKRFISLFMISVLVICSFAACGTVKDKNNNTVNGTFTEYLVAEQVGTFDRDDFTTAEGGIYYKDENGLYGVASFNGAYDTGAIYKDVTPRGEYFEVTQVAAANENDIEKLNRSYLIDGKGQLIVMGYATYDILNDRYIAMAKGTKRTYSQDDAVLSFTDSGLSCMGSSYDFMYEGVWAVYDMVTEQFVPRATGSNKTTIYANGRYITFTDENDKTLHIDENGEFLPDNATLFSDGSYSIEGKIGEVYDSDGNLMFNYDLTGYIPSDATGDYYSASKYEDGESKYVVMDTEGKVISSEFDTYFTIYGDIIYCDDKIYNLKGEQVIDGTYTSVKFDKMFNQNWMLINDDYYTLIDKNGAVFFNGPYDKEYTVWSTDFLASKEIDDTDYFWSHKDKDYTIEGSAFAPWIVRTKNANSLYDLVDTMTGKKLLEGYNSYDSISRNSMAYYVYAKYNGGADIYLVVSGTQLKDVTAKKETLFDDLAAVFEKEGIKATVNKETGEISLDSSVLFGGDSAELTADGKNFLNKFIKAYTTIISSKEYKGFISKTMVEGHTAPVEGSTYAGDLPLSQERAANVKNYCLSAETGVDISTIADTLEDVGYSNSKPVCDADGNVDLAASRRVSFRFIVNVDF